MNNSKNMLQNVACECSAYSKCSTCYNTPSERSCTNCSHYSKDDYCTLDLYDEIANRIMS